MRPFSTDILLRSNCSLEEKESLASDIQLYTDIYREYKNDRIDKQQLLQKFDVHRYPYLHDVLSKDEYIVGRYSEEYIKSTDSGIEVLRKILEMQFCYCFQQKKSIPLLHSFLFSLLEGEDEDNGCPQKIQDKLFA